MASIIRTDSLQNLNTSNIITQTNATTLTIGASGQTISIPAGATLTNNGTATGFGLTTQSVQTTGFTAVKGNLYPCNTTSASFTVTLPASASVGDQIAIVDYAGTFATNAITLNPNGNKINGSTGNRALNTTREGVIITYVDSTQGWLATSGVNEGTVALTAVYSVDFLTIAGGGAGGGYGGWGGGGGAGGYRSSNATYGSSGGGGSAESSLTLSQGVVYTITVGAGGTGNTGTTGANGVASSISGIGLTTITSSGGGGGGLGAIPPGGRNANNGGSGGGGGYYTPATGTGGSGTANQGFAGAASADASPNGNSGGGGGAGEAGNTDGISHGGDGVASTITGSSVTRGGGGGGINNGVNTTGGDGGGGTGDSSGTANTGGGGGGNQSFATNGGSGIVILRMTTANYSGTSTGSPTVTTSGADTILTFTGTGSYTG
jgi:hypothetical protein